MATGVGVASGAEKLARRLALLDALAGLARVTAESQDSAAALDGFSAAVRPLIPHDWVNVAWLEDDRGRFHLLGAIAHQAGRSPARSQEGDVAAAGRAIVGHTLRTGMPQVFDDYRTDPRWADTAPEVRALIEREGLHAGLVVALRVGGRVIGALVLD